jgi:phosphatidylserine/phosphatidylglycerophosphate/cardiolipin synthase-like enzyme
MWANARLLEWNEEIPAVETTPITDAQVDDAEGTDSVFTSANMNTYVSSYGPTFTTVSGEGAVRDELAVLFDSAQHSIWIASGHLRSRQITDALLHAYESNPDLDVRVYLDGQEYVSDGYHEDEVVEFDECQAEASTDIQRQRCLDRGLHFGWTLAEAGVDLRYKYYAYRWHYSYAPQMHHKYVIVDGETVASGSYNFSNNAERDTLENLVIYEAARYPDLVDDFEANFESIWQTGADGLYEDLMAQVVSGDSFPIVFDSMALPHDDVTALKSAIRESCPDITSDEYSSHPQSHQTCEK